MKRTSIAILFFAFLFSGCTLHREVAQLQSDVKQLQQENEAMRKEVGILNNTINFFPHE